MRYLPRFGIFFLACIFLAVVLTPWIYLGVQWSAHTLGWSCLEYLARHPFHRYFSRVLQVSILIGILRSLKWFGFTSFHAVGLSANRPFRFIWIGLIFSVIAFGGYEWALLRLGLHQAIGEPKSWFYLGWKIFFTGILIGFLEEVFFRGYLYRLCQQEVGQIWALILNAILFSVPHYVRPPRAEDLREVDWSSGFQILLIAWQRFSHPLQILSGLLILMAVAWMLCWTFDRTTNLYLGIGLHAGWIMMLQLSSEFARDNSGWPAWILGGGNLRDGVLALIPLLLQFLVLRWWLRYSPELKFRKSS